EDQISAPAGARAMAALIPNAQFHVVPAAGHLAPLEQPLATTRVIADFLETLRGGGASCPYAAACPAEWQSERRRGSSQVTASIEAAGVPPCSRRGPGP